MDRNHIAKGYKRHAVINSQACDISDHSTTKKNRLDRFSRERQFDNIISLTCFTIIDRSEHAASQEQRDVVVDVVKMFAKACTVKLHDASFTMHNNSEFKNC